MSAAEAIKQRKRAEAAQRRAEEACMTGSDAPALLPRPLVAPAAGAGAVTHGGGNGASADNLTATGTAGAPPPGPPWRWAVGPVVRPHERLPALRMMTAILVAWVAAIASGLMLHAGAQLSVACMLVQKECKEPGCAKCCLAVLFENTDPTSNRPACCSACPVGEQTRVLLGSAPRSLNCSLRWQVCHALQHLGFGAQSACTSVSGIIHGHKPPAGVSLPLLWFDQLLRRYGALLPAPILALRAAAVLLTPGARARVSHGGASTDTAGEPAAWLWHRREFGEALVVYAGITVVRWWVYGLHQAGKPHAAAPI